MYLSDSSTFYNPQTISQVKLNEIIDNLAVIIGSKNTAKNIIDKTDQGLFLTEFALLRHVRLVAENETHLTPHQAKKLQASLNLGSLLASPTTAKNTIIERPQSAAEALYPYLSNQPIEKFAVISLNQKSMIMAVKLLSIGTQHETLADPKSVFEAVILTGGSRCIIAHNHPSGDTTASNEDGIVTKQMISAGQVLNIEVLDHLIIGQNSYNSLKLTTSFFEA